MKPWLQPVAISGKSTARCIAKNKANPLPSVATGCRVQRMVRRGSTVRVRQRALQRPRKTGLFVGYGLPRIRFTRLWKGLWKNQTVSSPVRSDLTGSGTSRRYYDRPTGSFFRTDRDGRSPGNAAPDGAPVRGSSSVSPSSSPARTPSDEQDHDHGAHGHQQTDHEHP